MVQRNISIQQAYKEEGKKGLRHGYISLGGQEDGKEATGYKYPTPN